MMEYTKDRYNTVSIYLNDNMKEEKEKIKKIHRGTYLTQRKKRDSYS